MTREGDWGRWIDHSSMQQWWISASEHSTQNSFFSFSPLLFPLSLL